MSRNTGGKGMFFNDIDVLTKALYQDKQPQPTIGNSTASSRSKAVTKPPFPDTKSKSKVNSNEDRFLKDKKSIWNWKNTLKSFTHVRSKRFNCCFSLQVHSIEGLPPSFDNLTLCVKWKRRDGELTTRPALVLKGVAEFEELLTNTCLVSGSRSGPHHSAKYEAKHFLLYASVFSDPEVDLGKHRVDLTRLLPLTLEELEDEKSSGKWTTTYRLSGKAKGATMNVSFGYSIVGSNVEMVNSSVKASAQSQLKRGESLPVNSHSVEDIKDLHEVLPVSKSELSESVSMLYKKLEEEEEEKSIISVDYETKQAVQVVPSEPVNQDLNSTDYDNINSEFSVMEQGIEIPSKENVKEDALKGFDGSSLESLLVERSKSQTEECVVSESNTKEKEFDDKELLLQELELALNNVTDLKEESDSQEESECLNETECSEVKTGYKEKGKSLKLDYDTEIVADDFLNMLGIEHSPFSLTSESESNSPRERLLRQFEKDSMANGSSLFNFNLDDDDIDMLGCTPEEPPRNKTNASILEEMETKSLMCEWGLNENVSSPVVVPAEMGSGIMDVLQCLASVGIEKLSMQANKLMPLEDISGKTIQQIAWESTPSLEAPPYRQDSLQQEPILGQNAVDHFNGRKTGRRSKQYELDGVDQEYVSLEDLAPLAMNKIEALSIEGLRIQSGMSDKDAPSNISPQSIGEISALEGKRVNFDGSLGLEGAGGLQLLDVKNSSGGGGGGGNDDDVDGIMGLSVTLDEWMRLDAGEIDDGDEISERTSRILAAHHASDLMRARIGKKGSKKGGLLGNNFTVALMVQLRDPLRNFEPVGTPMLALVQVERVFVPPKPKVYSSIFSSWKKPEEKEEVDEVKVEEKKEAFIEEKEVCVEESVLVPQFKITEVHVAGVKTEPESKKKSLWGSNAKQQQAGSRWLVANGMGKNAKHPLMKSKVGGGADKSGGSLWSISSKGKGKGKVDPPERNPNVIIPNETVKLLSGAGFI
ncbi:putative NT-type C2 domain, protein PLASTID MOVEMENT IMPAIRED 1 [Helianthus annuus]|nr:putative NT-type C2 domain, protein PLASTID MOVEMENT IMPAIRED 1 [Helianthus annuus]